MNSTSVFFCGDIINMYSRSQFIGEQLRHIISSCDYAVGNLEGVLCLEDEVKPMMQNRSTLQALKEAGINLLLLANNHITDYGSVALDATINMIEKAGLSHVGAGFTYSETYKPFIITVNDVTIGIINLCEAQVGQWDAFRNDYGYAWIGDINVPVRIKELRQSVDFVVACVHCGLEHKTLPLPFFRRFYRSICDLGVDCVIGSHPHVVQGIEHYKEKLIFYSLGNFFFPKKLDQGTEDRENQAFSCIISFTKGRPLSYSLVHHSVSSGTVEVDTTHRWDVEELSKRLLSPHYDYESRLLVRETYLHHVRPQLSYSMLGMEGSDSLYTKAKKIIKYLFCDSETGKLKRERLLNRLIVNETYRSIIELETGLSLRK